VNKRILAGLVILAVTGCGSTAVGAVTSGTPAMTATSTAAAQVSQAPHFNIGTSYLVYIPSGQSTATVKMTLDQVVTGASEIPAEQPPPGYVIYGFEFTVRGVSGSGSAWTQNFLGQNSAGTYTAQNLAPSDLTETPDEFKQDYIDYSPGSVETGWVGFAFPAGVDPARVSFEVGSLSISSLYTGNDNPTWGGTATTATATPTASAAPSRQAACSRPDPAECLLAVNAVSALDTGAEIDPPAGMTLVSDDTAHLAAGFAAAEFKDANGNIIIADEDADLASPFGTATPYQNASFAAEAEVVLGIRPKVVLADAVRFASQVKAADTDSAPIYVTGFGLGGVEAQAQALALSSGIAGGVTFGAAGLPGNTTADNPDTVVNFADYGDSIAGWSSDPGGELIALAPAKTDHYGQVDQVGDSTGNVLVLLAANTSKLTTASMLDDDFGQAWHDGDGFDKVLRFLPEPSVLILKTYDGALQTASYAYLAGAAVQYHSIAQYAKDLGVSLVPTVAPAISMADYVKMTDPSASTTTLQAAAATTVTADGAVTGPGYQLTANTATERLDAQAFTGQDGSQYDVEYDPAEMISSLKVNEPGGTSYEIFNDDADQYQWSTRVDFYSGPGQTGTLLETLYNWDAGGSQLQVFTGLPQGDTREILNYSQPDAAGTPTSTQFN
jgi:hypothetical protein